jgi:hypothetical protein
VAHLLKFRKGWENERLAAFLLSRFSFVAHPASVADDLGSDFFCTIFEVHNESGTDSLAPRKSFAIQIKSSAGEFNVDNKIDYLQRLELPFFIGVVNQSQNQMTIYSAEFIPLLFSLHDVHKLSLVPVEASVFDRDNYCKETEPNALCLHCPSVITLGVEDDRATLSSKVAVLLELCGRVHRNIATKVSNEHIYETDDSGNLLIMAGPGSMLVFRKNFLKRLAEVFYNLDWMFEKVSNKFREEEFLVFEKVYLELSQFYGSPLPHVTTVYSKLKTKVGNRAV